MSEYKTYNGYANYETWVVNLWLENDEGTSNYWRDEARRHRDEAPECEQVEDGSWTVKQAAKFNLAHQLKDELEDGSPISEASLYSDLLNGALSEVNWYEVAAAFLEGLEPESTEEVK